MGLEQTKSFKSVENFKVEVTEHQATELERWFRCQPVKMEVGCSASFAGKSVLVLYYRAVLKAGGRPGTKPKRILGFLLYDPATDLRYSTGQARKASPA